MSIINRQPKHGNPSGGSDYVTDTLIESAEVNVDFNLIYNDYDGNVDSTNIRAGSITGDRLVDGTITATQLGTDSVTTIKIKDLAVTTAKLAGDIPSSKLAIGATVSHPIGAVVVPTSQLVLTSEVTLVDTGAFTARGSPVLLTGFASFVCTMGGAAITSINVLTVRIYSYDLSGPSVLQAVNVEATWASAGAEVIHFPAVVPFSIVGIPGTGPGCGFRVSVQASVQQTGPPTSDWSTISSSAGFLQGIELS